MAKKPENEFNPGDIVRIVSGGPDMSVIEYEEPTIYEDMGVYKCAWFNKNGDIQSDEFSSYILELVQKSNKYKKKEPEKKKLMIAIAGN